MAKLSENEARICARLREFREATAVPRSRFAVTLGIGSERLAAYESARAPVRVELFLLLSKHWHINPHWLASGDGLSHTMKVFKVTDFTGKTGKDLFSKAYAECLLGKFDLEVYMASDELLRLYKTTDALLKSKGPLKKAIAEQWPLAKTVVTQMLLLIKEILPLVREK